MLLDLGGTAIRRIIIYANEEGVRFLQGTAPPPEGGDAVSSMHFLRSESLQDDTMHHKS